MGQSRTENILENMLGASNPIPEPQSREETLLKQILESGGGGGATALSGLSDVDLSSPSDGQVLKYNNTSQKWENANESGGNGHTYSSDEQEVGTWIDGSTIYEKTLHFTDVTIQAGNNVSFPIANYISNMKQVISFNGCCSTYDGYTTTYVVLPYEGMWDGTEWSLLIACDSVNIVITRAAPSGSHHLSDIYVTLQYTKTES